MSTAGLRSLIAKIMNWCFAAILSTSVASIGLPRNPVITNEIRRMIFNKRSLREKKEISFSFNIFAAFIFNERQFLCHCYFKRNSDREKMWGKQHIVHCVPFFQLDTFLCSENNDMGLFFLSQSIDFV